MTDLLALSSDLPVADVSPGTALIEEGTRPGRMFVLASGEVVVEHDGVPFARIDTPGAVFGEMSVVLDRAATATVRAAGDVRVHVVDDPTRFLTDTPGAALAVLRTTASRLDGMTHYLVDVKRQFADHGGHLGLVDRILDTLLHHQGPRARTGSARDPEGDHVHDEE
ncbi:cyclic nucleotide-binding domain-containing protein [Blastococcus sp. URHD0036]|uniref:cyclic nucleotide-binding domain-containing protein n=1 Tax=Blastococcus sp. URHD0036 TaxID=1380356 RepID=UPI0006918191|nr:cyclic nucleotide-binding domain-containing protein [Blastococcus sp. URHD0036]